MNRVVMSLEQTSSGHLKICWMMTSSFLEPRESSMIITFLLLALSLILLLISLLISLASPGGLEKK